MPKKKIIETDTVKHVARLSRLELTSQEVGLYEKQLVDILGYIDKLNKVDTSNITPTSHPIENIKNVFRKDIRKKSLPVDDALSNAPRKKDNFFTVPKIID